MTDVMTAAYEEDLLTPCSFDDAEPIMRWALGQQMGHEPSDETVALALSKTGLETARWQAIHRSNWGNIKAAPAYEGMYTCYACNEVLAGKVVWFSPRGRLDGKGGKVIAEAYDAEPFHPQTRFRSYANHYAGVSEYTDLIATSRYKVAWAKLLSANVTGFVHELKLAGYFTADESLYLKGVSGLYNELLLRVKKLPHEHAVADFDTDAILATIRGDQFAHANYAQSGADVGGYESGGEAPSIG